MGKKRKKLNKPCHVTRKSGMAILLSASLAANVLPGGLLGENLAMAAESEKKMVTGLENLPELTQLEKEHGVANTKNNQTNAKSETSNENYVDGEAIILYKDAAVKAFSNNGGIQLDSDGGLQGKLEDGIQIVDTCKFAASKNKKGTRSTGLNAKNCYVSLVKSDKYSTEELIEKLKEKGNIQYVEPNYKVKALELNEDPYEKYQWALKNSGQNGGTQGLDTDAIDTEIQQDTDDKEKVVAVVDTGVNYESDDLKNMMWKNTNSSIQGLYGYDFVNDDTDPLDDNGHGSHCAGIMAAEAGNGVGTSGIARSKNVKIMALKALNANGEGESYAFVKAYQYIYNAQQAGVNVVAINNSWGGSSQDATSNTLDELMNKVGEAGALSICAAGNDGEDNDQVVSLPANSDSPYVISVAASNEKDELAGFSNYGKNNVDLAAPGTDILSTVAKDTFNPSIYENKDELCESFEDFSDGNLVETVGQNPSGAQVQDGDIQYGTYAAGSTNSWTGATSAAQGTVSVELSHENYFGTDGESGKSLKWHITGAKSGETYCLYLPYTTTQSSTAVYDSVMIRATGTNLGQNEIIYVADGELNSNGYSLNNPSYVGQGGTYIDKRGNYWTHISGEAASTGTSANQKRAMAFMIKAASSGDYTVYIDDAAISKSNVDSAAFGKYDFYNGTSMATPFVTGAVAVLANAFSEDSASERKDKILNNVRKSSDLTDKVSTGGVLDLSQIHKDTEPVEDQQEFEQVASINGNLSEGSIVSGGDAIYYVEKDGAVSTGKKQADNQLDWSKKDADFKEAWNHSGIELTGEPKMETGVVRNGGKLWTVLADSNHEDNCSKILASYTEKNGWSYEATLPSTWDDLTHFTLSVYQGKLYVLGGLKQADGSCASSVCAYNLETKNWENVADMPEGRAFAKAGQADSKLVLSMGYSQNGENTCPADLVWENGNWTESKNQDAEKYQAPTKQYQWQKDGNSQTIQYYDSPAGVNQTGFVYVGWSVDGKSKVVLKNEKDSQGQLSTSTYSYENQIGASDTFDAATAGDSLYILKQTEQDKNEQKIEVLRMPIDSAAVEVKNASGSEEGWKGTGMYLPGELIAIEPEEEKYLKDVKVNGASISVNENGNCYYVAKAGEEIEVSVESGRAIKQIQMDEQLELYPGDSKQLNYQILPEDADDKEVVWTSSDESVATIDANGFLQISENAKAGQEIEIRVSSKKDANVYAICKVVILEKEEPSTEPSTEETTEETTDVTVETTEETTDVTVETSEETTELTSEETSEVTTEASSEETTASMVESSTEETTEETTTEPVSETETSQETTDIDETSESATYPWETTEENITETTTGEPEQSTPEETSEAISETTIEPTAPDPTTETPEETTEEPTAPDPTTETAEETTEEPTAPEETTEGITEESTVPEETTEGITEDTTAPEETTEGITEDTTVPEETTEGTTEDTTAPEETTEEITEETTEETETTTRWQWPTWWWEETTTEETTTEKATTGERPTTVEATSEETTSETTTDETETTSKWQRPTPWWEETTTERQTERPTNRPTQQPTEWATTERETEETTKIPEQTTVEETTRETEQATTEETGKTPEQTTTEETGKTPEQTTTEAAGKTPEQTTTEADRKAPEQTTAAENGMEQSSTATTNKTPKQSSNVKKIVRPKRVSAVKVKWKKGKKICITWKKQGNVKGYKIYKYNTKKKKYCLAKTVRTNYYIFKTNNKVGTMKFKIRAFNKGENKVLMGAYSRVIRTGR